MQKNSADSALTLSQRIYLIARSLRTLGNWLRLLLIINLFFLSLGWAQEIYSFDISCFCIHRDYTFYQLVYFELSLMTVYLLVYFLFKGPSTYKKLKEWNEDYLEEAYTIVFGTTIPKGSTTGERVFNLARAIFPELTSDYVRLAAGYQDRIKLYFKKKLGRLRPVNISQSLNYKVNSDYSVDLALKLPLEEGYFIVKDFKEKVVTLEDLKNLVKAIRGRFKDIYQKTDIFRTVIVAKDYDPSFLNRESLETLMKRDLKANFKIDLIVEEKVGYSVLWVS